MNDYDYILANIFDTSRHIQQRINSPFRSALTIYEKARNTKKSNIYTISILKNNGFEKAIYKTRLGLYNIYPIYDIMEKCFRDQDNMY